MTSRHQKPIIMGEPPEPGYYTMKLIRHGPVVGAQITFDPVEGYRVMRDGTWEGPSKDPWALPLMHSVAFATKSTPAEVTYRIGVKRWAEIYQPDHASANPARPLNLDTIIPF